MGKISNLSSHKKYMHPKVLAAFEELDAGTAPLVDWDFVNQFRRPDGSIWEISESFRTWESQDKEYLKIPRTTHLKGGESYHQWGLAVDLIFSIPRWGVKVLNGISYNFALPEVYEKSGLVAFMAARGLSWLGRIDLVDVAHHEYRISHPTTKEKSGTAWWIAAEGGNVKKYIGYALAVFAALVLFRKMTKGATMRAPYSVRV